MNIIIDTANHQIVFVHLFLPIKKIYSFSDFDYYIETIEHSVGDHSKAIYLIKNNRQKEAIRGYYYSNVNEMLKALNGISNHGFKKFGLLRVMLFYFSKKL